MARDFSVGPVYGPDCEVSFCWNDGNLGRSTNDGSKVVQAKNVLQVFTHRSLHEAAGAFEITLDMTPQDGGWTWDQLLQPMDFVLIRIGRRGDPDGANRVVMRGFIDNVRFTDSYQAGLPQRRIIIQGRDFLGLSWSVARFLTLAPPIQTVVASVWDAYQIWNNYGIPGDATSSRLPIRTLFENLINKVVKPYIDQQQKRLPGAPLAWHIDTSEIDDELQLQYFIPSSLDGAVYNIIQQTFDQTFLEYHTIDGDFDSFYRFRYAYYRQSTGELVSVLFTPLPDPPISHIAPPVEQALNLVRSSQEVMNWFYVKNTYGITSSDGVESFAGPNNPFIVGQSIDEYGLRPLQLAFKYYAALNKRFPERQQQQNYNIELAQMIARWLAGVFGSYQYYYSGVYRIKGLPIYQMGDEVFDDLRQLRAYLVNVDHEYVYPATENEQGSWMTDLSLIRAAPLTGVAPAQYSFPASAAGVPGLLSAFDNPTVNFGPSTTPR